MRRNFVTKSFTIHQGDVALVEEFVRALVAERRKDSDASAAATMKARGHGGGAALVPAALAVDCPACGSPDALLVGGQAGSCGGCGTTWVRAIDGTGSRG